MDPIFNRLSNLELLTLLLYGEARGEGLDGMLAVASVVMNRVAMPGWWGKDIKSVMIKPKQFSCFNPDDPNSELLAEFAEVWHRLGSIASPLRSAYWIAKGILDGYLSSNVSVATHYNTIDNDPKWDDKMKLIKRIGNHEFYV